MKRLTTLCCLMCVCGASNLAIGRTPLPMDPPTPPPCAADGTCYPRTGEWGYYPVRWRTWPGAGMEPVPASLSPTPAQRRVSPELGHSETPRAELEDAAAPPSSPKRETPTAPPPKPSETAPSDGAPDVPLPDDETDLFGPTTDHDPPPALPWSFTNQGRVARNRQAAALPRKPLGTPRVSTNDPPPAPPWGQSAAL